MTPGVGCEGKTDWSFITWKFTDEAVRRSGLREKAIIDAAVTELAELGRAKLVKDGKKKLIQIRPELLGAAS